ncbi:MAG: ABC transporter substrate-binding protein [Bacteroidales bacterium]|nr:ABC transporter substrate-binding protein [Bacteroidales bacterium]MBQ7734381.1 ABC transporter substrate-binding protein [Bacteroidales bacterium]
MKKYIFSLFMILLALVPYSAGAKEKTILFLIPFYSQSYSSQQVASIREYEDLAAVKSFQLMGFWAGAQVALEEYNQKNTELKVIVRDVSDNESKLRAILEDRELMGQVDLIIGPFFSRPFAMAARYAKEYGIPIVNPFTNRTDFMAGNEYVYKLIPSMEARPATLTFIADQFPKHQIILYADSSRRSRNVQIYTHYFKEKKIPYKCIPSSKTLVKELLPGQKNIVLSLMEETAPNMMLSRELVYGIKPDDLMFIMPESMLKSNTVEVEYFDKLNVHFFSDYYVDFKNEQTQVFIHDYTERFKTPPTLENFAFQGYDVTRFFVEWLLNGKDLDLVKIEPIAYRLSFDKVPDGGYENVNVQFLEIIDNEIHPAGY